MPEANPLVGIVMGSQSDWPTMRHAAATLEALWERRDEFDRDFVVEIGRAAVAGGFAAVACMANTDPVNDDPSVTEYIIERARQNPLDRC